LLQAKKKKNMGNGSKLFVVTLVAITTIEEKNAMATRLLS
jgi:hypothetical protein